MHDGRAARHWMRVVAVNTTAERGGSFGRDGREARNWMRASAPGIARRCRPAESSPLGSGPYAARAAALGSRRTIKLALVTLLAGAGLAAFGNGLYIHAKAQFAQVLLHAAWTRTQATGIAARPWPWADLHPVARLIAPGQDSDLLVLSGASGRTLAFGPGHLDGSAVPGERGNSVISGHRDTHFRFLQHVSAGDLLLVEGIDGARRHFRVQQTYVADVHALQLPRNTFVPTLTLVTCFPFDAIKPGGPLRFVVVAEAA
jgi:sortase A